MKDMAKGAATASAISFTGLTGSAALAQAYQIEHSIVLSLAAASPCAQAEVRLVFDAYQEMFP